MYILPNISSKHSLNITKTACKRSCVISKISKDQGIKEKEKSTRQVEMMILIQGINGYISGYEDIHRLYDSHYTSIK